MWWGPLSPANMWLSRHLDRTLADRLGSVCLSLQNTSTPSFTITKAPWQATCFLLFQGFAIQTQYVWHWRMWYNSGRPCTGSKDLTLTSRIIKKHLEVSLCFLGVCGRVLVSASPGDTWGHRHDSRTPRRSRTWMAIQMHPLSFELGNSCSLYFLYMSHFSVCHKVSITCKSKFFKEWRPVISESWRGLVNVVGLLLWPVQLKSKTGIWKCVFSVQLDY